MTFEELNTKRIVELIGRLGFVPQQTDIFEFTDAVYQMYASKGYPIPMHERPFVAIGKNMASEENTSWLPYAEMEIIKNDPPKADGKVLTLSQFTPAQKDQLFMTISLLQEFATQKNVDITDEKAFLSFLKWHFKLNQFKRFFNETISTENFVQ